MIRTYVLKDYGTVTLISMNARLYKPIIAKKRKRDSEKFFPVNSPKVVTTHEKVVQNFVQSTERIEEVFSNNIFEKSKVKRTKTVKLEPSPSKPIPIVTQAKLGKRRPDRIRSPRSATLCDHPDCHEGEL